MDSLRRSAKFCASGHNPKLQLSTEKMTNYDGIWAASDINFRLKGGLASPIDRLN
jgi:hypothetical protein